MYPFVDKATGTRKFGRLKFACHRFTLVHRQAKPGQVCTLLWSNHSGVEKFTWTNSYGEKREYTKHQFHAQFPAKLGDATFQAICREIY